MSDTRAIIEIPFHLAELPSSQHRAGLAGLVLVVRELQRDPDLEGVCEIYDLAHTGATLRIDRQGLREMFDEVYAAAIEEQPRPRPYKDRNKNENNNNFNKNQKQHQNKSKDKNENDNLDEDEDERGGDDTTNTNVSARVAIIVRNSPAGIWDLGASGRPSWEI